MAPNSVFYADCIHFCRERLPEMSCLCLQMGPFSFSPEVPSQAHHCPRTKRFRQCRTINSRYSSLFPTLRDLSRWAGSDIPLLCYPASNACHSTNTTQQVHACGLGLRLVWPSSEHTVCPISEMSSSGKPASKHYTPKGPKMKLER